MRSLSRRRLLGGTAGLAGTLCLIGTRSVRAAQSAPAPKWRRIAVEEAFATPQLLALLRQTAASSMKADPGFHALYGPLLSNPRSQNLLAQLNDIGAARLAAMDASGVSMHVLSLTAPGVQVFSASRASDLARSHNDLLAEAVANHPGRFAGLACVAPQDPTEAAREIRRAIRELGLKGVLINSHVRGEYLDNLKFRPMFEAAAELDVPIYLHPSTPAPGMVRPYLAYGLEGPAWGFAAETGLHALRLVMSGLFDDLPGLRMVLGHLGEGVPFWLARIDSRARLIARVAAKGRAPKLRGNPGEYFKQNWYFTTSGMPWHGHIQFVASVVGLNRLMFAADYPYESQAEAVAAIEESPFSDGDKRRIFQTTAEAVFKLNIG